MLVASNVFLKITEELSAIWKLSPLFVSLVVTALGTNLPELTVTLVSIQNNDHGLAMGNLVGSCIANLSIILGLSTLFGKVRIGTTKTPKNATILAIATLLFSVLMLSSVRIEYQIILMLLMIVFALIFQYRMAVSGRLHEDKKFLALIEKVTKKKKHMPKIFYIVLFVGTLIGLAIGGRVTVKAVEDLAVILGLSTTFLGLTLTAVATSLPELLLSIIASTKNENKVVLGTLIGSNIFNLSLFPAIILSSTTALKFRKFITIKEIFFLLLITAMFYSLVVKKQGTVIDKKMSMLLMLIFPLFTLFIFYF
ncbi:MAG: sodium:calcium antiporter [Patescibacteria group bacterium]|nr:MAG: sodium:calcium antiporter [Patescibacteria group bacterium]